MQNCLSSIGKPLAQQISPAALALSAERRRQRCEISGSPMWREHARTVAAFRIYLQNTADLKIRVSGMSEFEGEENTVTRELPYIHRWTPVYKNMVLAKFYRLEAYMTENPCSCITMLTLTTYHAFDQFGRRVTTNDVSIPDSFQLLKRGWDKLRDAIRPMGYDFVWIMEPHRSGYPHIHVAIFGDFGSDRDEKTGISLREMRVKKLWNKYGCGSVEHGAKFSYKAGESSVKSIRNYLMKYMVKGWGDSKWTTAQLVFNALVWDNGWRLWDSSKGIKEIMKIGQPEKSKIDWQLSEMKTTRYGDYTESWRRPLEVGEYDFHNYDWRGKRSKIEALVPDNQPIKDL
jgi:hypothetical protein